MSNQINLKWHIAGFLGEHEEAGVIIKDQNNETVLVTDPSKNSTPECWQEYMRLAESIVRDHNQSACSPSITQGKIDISNLRFYASLAREFQWQTDIIHWGVVEQTLNEIADRYATLQPTESEN